MKCALLSCNDEPLVKSQGEESVKLYSSPPRICNLFLLADKMEAKKAVCVRFKYGKWFISGLIRF